MKRNGARSVTVIQTYSSYARMDKKDGAYKSLTYADLARFTESAGVDRLFTLDIHNPAVLVHIFYLTNLGFLWAYNPG